MGTTDNGSTQMVLVAGSPSGSEPTMGSTLYAAPMGEAGFGLANWRWRGEGYAAEKEREESRGEKGGRVVGYLQGESGISARGRG